ncbi:hypothetical protein PG988_005665 [Apiospora saccharicola]
MAPTKWNNERNEALLVAFGNYLITNARPEQQMQIEDHMKDHGYATCTWEGIRQGCLSRRVDIEAPPGLPAHTGDITSSDEAPCHVSGRPCFFGLASAWWKWQDMSALYSISPQTVLSGTSPPFRLITFVCSFRTSGLQFFQVPSLDQSCSVRIAAVQTASVQVGFVQIHFVSTDFIQYAFVQLHIVSTDSIQYDSVQIHFVPTESIQYDSVRRSHSTTYLTVRNGSVQSPLTTSSTVTDDSVQSL